MNDSARRLDRYARSLTHLVIAPERLRTEPGVGCRVGLVGHPLKVRVARLAQQLKGATSRLLGKGGANRSIR